MTEQTTSPVGELEWLLSLLDRDHIDRDACKQSALRLHRAWCAWAEDSDQLAKRMQEALLKQQALLHERRLLAEFL